jgi:hypothetical protein
MASLNGTFDANAVEPSAPRDIIPPGEYLVQIVESEMADTKRGDGQMLKLTMDILEGPHAGRKLWDRLNLVNPNAQAVEIAQRTLSAICHATGRLQVSDSEQLHFIPLVATVKVRPAGMDKSGVQREAQNEIGGYKPAGGTARPAPAPQQQTRQAAPPPAQTKPAATAAPPWRRTA